MKTLIACALGTFLCCGIHGSLVLAEDLPAGQVDFGTFSPPGEGGQFVEVNLPGSLISMAARIVEKEEPDVAQLLKGLQSVRVNVVGVDDENRSELETRIQGIRKQLDSKGWEKLVTARQQGQDVGVYLKTGNKQSIQGLVVTVMDGKKQAVFVNIVGEIRPEQVSMLGERLHLDPLKKAGDAIGNKQPAEKQ
jgi:hypothetical protein